MSRGRDYLTRTELVREIERRFAAMSEEGAGGKGPEVGEVREVQPPCADVVEEPAERRAGAGDGPQLRLVRRDSPTRKLSSVAVVTPDARHVCSWCASQKPKALPPLVVEHPRSGIAHRLSLCAALRPRKSV
jgi:hypothetical protein